MLDPFAPDTNVRLKSNCERATDPTILSCHSDALSPLMKKSTIVTLTNNVLALRFFQFEIFADFVNNDATLFTLQNLGEPAIRKFVT